MGKSGFVSVESGRGAGVMARASSGGWVWACRALPASAGWHRAPACLFVPFACHGVAGAFAQAAARSGWRVWVRSGRSGSAVWSACGLAVPAFTVKVALPVGVTSGVARSQLSAFLPSQVAA